jgi:hypothetical protein
MKIGNDQQVHRCCRVDILEYGYIVILIDHITGDLLPDNFTK